MAFSNPIWLWGFSGLLIPLTIHLLSRKEGQVIPIGSLRHLQDANTQQFKSLRLNEILLLILRSSLIVLIVLLLSGLQWKNISQQKWILVEDNIKDQPQAKALADSLKKDGYEVHSLSSGFPTTQNINQQRINYWQLVEELKSKELSNAVIIASAKAESFKGLRIKKSDNIQWITVSEPAHEYLVSAKKNSSDSLNLKVGSLENGNTRHSIIKAKLAKADKYYKFKNDSVSVTFQDTVNILLAADHEFGYDRKIFLASLKALENFVPAIFQITQEGTDLKNQSGKNSWLIWLSEKESPSTLTKGKIVYKKTLSDKILQQQSADTWALTSRLNQDLALEKNLTLLLSEVLFPSINEWRIADSKDQRIMPEQMMWNDSTDGESLPVENASLLPLEKPLIILILFLLAIERLVSYKRNQ
jgi:hypothetical protein